MHQNQARRAPLRAAARPKHATVWARMPTWSALGLTIGLPVVALIAYAAPSLHAATRHPAPVAAERPAAVAAQQNSQVQTTAPLPPAPINVAVPVVGAPPAVSTPVQFTGTAGNANPPEEVAAVSPLAADGIPRTALNAYENGAQRANLIYPTCQIPWPLLAGIGRVESDHGRFGGAVLYSNGTSSHKILGIPLDGTRSAKIPDTDNGRLDGDKVWDRAVGPMQFIPSTWRSYGVDGNGDGVVDPFNIFDAAAAAADYLCVAGGDLGTEHGQERAVLAYNHSSAYLAEVLGLERTYAAGVGLIVPVGPAAPTPPKKTPHVPPVDPGPPLGHKPHAPQHSHHPTKHPSSAAPSTSSSPTDAPSTSTSPAPSSSAPSSSGASSSCPVPSTSASSSSGRSGSPRLPTDSSSSSPQAPVSTDAGSDDGTSPSGSSANASTSVPTSGSTSTVPTC
jgi:membrane-bound lytic murein transglycosylase B